MPTIVMHWDRRDPFGNTLADIEVDSHPTVVIEVPPDACGFRLERPDRPWEEAWYFAVKGSTGAEFRHGTITYASWGPGVPHPPPSISARGPVRACAAGGSYEFETPLASLGVTGADPVNQGAGAFVADVGDERDITWLDAAGDAIERPSSVDPPEPPELPREFFDRDPDLRGCFYDFEGTPHCPQDADTTTTPRSRRLDPPGRIASAVAPDVARASTSGVVAGVAAIPTLAVETGATRPAGRVEVTCPAQLVLIATFHKNAGFGPATVRYRFRFIHGPVSTVFAARVDRDGPNTAYHSVPIPLPAPIRADPDGRVPRGLADLAARQREDPDGDGRSVVVPNLDLTAEPLPDNEHKGAVRVEVVNAVDEVLVSGWAPYHLACSPRSVGPAGSITAPAGEL